MIGHGLYILINFTYNIYYEGYYNPRRTRESSL
jgi:hypothetical protein